MLIPERRRSGHAGKLHRRPGPDQSRRVGPTAVEEGGQEGGAGLKGEPGDAELGGELVSPAEEEIGDEGHRGVTVGPEPLDDWGLEL